MRDPAGEQVGDGARCHGFGPLAAQYDHYYLVESFWLLVGLDSGPIVLFMYLVLIVVLLRRGMQAGSRTGYLSTAAVSGTLVSQIVLPTLQAGSVSFLLWLVAGIAIAVQEEEKRVAEETKLSADGSSAPIAAPLSQ